MSGTLPYKIRDDMKTLTLHIAVPLLMLAAVSCEELDNDIDKHVQDQDSTYIGLDEVAAILSSIPFQITHIQETHTAVTSSIKNGYDEEYTMKDLFDSPGCGVGEVRTRSSAAYERPLRELIEEYVRSGIVTKSQDGGPDDPDVFLEALMSSDIQIYWPFSERWDGASFPIITYDPEDGSDVNIGYRLSVENDGSRHVEEVIVDEAMAAEEPVWIVNRNSDAGYKTLEMLRREDPAWGEGGGTIIVQPPQSAASPSKSSSGSFKSLILKDFTMNRNYDSWFAGASEFFVKTGSLDDFTASTEAELRLYNPMVTDFMIVVKRNQVGKPQPFNAVLITDWNKQMTHCAFMITEDDGGTRTEWKCTALVRISSRSYGVELNLPFNSRDDIVWRGQLASRWIETNSNLVGHFGDVDLTFEVVEY